MKTAPQAPERHWDEAVDNFLDTLAMFIVEENLIEPVMEEHDDDEDQHEKA